MLDRSALTRRAAAVAIREAERRTTYNDLAQQVGTVLSELRGAGVRPRQRVVLRCTPSVETVSMALALLEHHCVVLPMSSEAISTPDLAESFAPHWEVSPGRIAPLLVRADPCVELGDEPVQALRSSGSAGTPKIVLRNRAQVDAGVRIFSSAMALAADDRVALLVPLEHSFGFNSIMLGALNAGAEIVLPRARHPRDIVSDITEAGVTVFAAAPIFFDWMQRFADGRRAALGQVRICVSVGDALSRSTYDSFADVFGMTLWQSYGASEAGPLLLNRDGAGSPQLLALGAPYPEVSVEIRDDAGRLLDEGEVGEIVARSPAVGLGYVGQHDGTSRISGREFYTGDLGVRRGNDIAFAGRRKIAITRAGRKIDPAEIERTLLTHPGVIDAAVHAIRGGDGEPMRALVVTRGTIAAPELIEHCARRLEAYKVPRRIETRAQLPRDGTGKLQRDKLPGW